MTWPQDQPSPESQGRSESTFVEILDRYVAALQHHVSRATQRLSLLDPLDARHRRYADLLERLDDARRVLFDDSNAAIDDRPVSPDRQQASAFEEFEGTERFRIIRRIGSG
jgi:hypothetical protein